MFFPIALSMNEKMVHLTLFKIKLNINIEQFDIHEKMLTAFIMLNRIVHVLKEVRILF